MDYAAAGGHLEVVKWLHENRTEGCTTDAIDRAAAGGHLEVIKLLHQYGACGTSKALENASKYGHLEVVRYLVENNMCLYTIKAIIHAASKAYIEVFDYLSQKFPHLVYDDLMHKLVSAIAANGYVETLEQRHTQWSKYLTVDALEAAVMNGHLETVIWLHETAQVPFGDRTINIAAAHGYLKIVDYLYKAGAPVQNNSIDDTIDDATQNGYLDILKYLTGLC